MQSATGHKTYIVLSAHKSNLPHRTFGPATLEILQYQMKNYKTRPNNKK